MDYIGKSAFSLWNCIVFLEYGKVLQGKISLYLLFLLVVAILRGMCYFMGEEVFMDDKNLGVRGMVLGGVTAAMAVFGFGHLMLFFIHISANRWLQATPSALAVVVCLVCAVYLWRMLR